MRPMVWESMAATSCRAGFRDCSRFRLTCGLWCAVVLCAGPAGCKVQGARCKVQGTGTLYYRVCVQCAVCSVCVVCSRDESTGKKYDTLPTLSVQCAVCAVCEVGSLCSV